MSSFAPSFFSSWLPESVSIRGSFFALVNRLEDGPGRPIIITHRARHGSAISDALYSPGPGVTRGKGPLRSFCEPRLFTHSLLSRILPQSSQSFYPQIAQMYADSFTESCHRDHRAPRVSVLCGAFGLWSPSQFYSCDSSHS